MHIRRSRAWLHIPTFSVFADDSDRVPSVMLPFDCVDGDECRERRSGRCHHCGTVVGCQRPKEKKGSKSFEILKERADDWQNPTNTATVDACVHAPGILRPMVRGERGVDHGRLGTFFTRVNIACNAFPLTCMTTEARQVRRRHCNEVF